jgi:hypothetical protein
MGRLLYSMRNVERLCEVQIIVEAAEAAILEVTEIEKI